MAKLNKGILDDLTVRFILFSPEFISLLPEEYFFIIEEAYWFALDFYSLQEMTLLAFAEVLLLHNGILLNTSHDYSLFHTYKQTIKVYGTMMFNPEMTHCLLVQQQGSSTAITFPKGKKSKDETGMECAIRETKEEVGFDVKNKITKLSVKIFDKITLYFVFNVNFRTQFNTQTRNEISRIFWFDLRKIDLVKQDKNYKLFLVAYAQASKILKRIKGELFYFDREKIISAIRDSYQKQNV